MNDLSLDGDVLVLFNFALLGNIFDLLFRDVLRNVLSEIFDSVVVSDSNFSRNLFDSDFFSVLSDSSSLGNSFDLGLILVLDNFLLERHIFDSAFALDDLFSSIDNSINNTRLNSRSINCRSNKRSSNRGSSIGIGSSRHRSSVSSRRHC